MRASRYLVFLLPLLLAACGLSPQEKADYAAVGRSGVSPAVYDKMAHGDNLSVHDIASLSRAHVNPGIILRYLRDHGTVYFLSTADIKSLQNAGVDSSIIDYMLQTSRGWGGGPYPYYGWGYGPGFYGPYGPYGYGYGPYGPGFGGVFFIGGHGGHHH